MLGQWYDMLAPHRVLDHDVGYGGTVGCGSISGSGCFTGMADHNLTEVTGSYVNIS